MLEARLERKAGTLREHLADLIRSSIPAIILIALISSAVSFLAFATFNSYVVLGTGTVRFLDIEGGFYGICSDDGEHYDSVNLDDDFKVDGLRVGFVARMMPELSSFHMWGHLVFLLHIHGL